MDTAYLTAFSAPAGLARAELEAFIS